jgi:hypothetical protein
MKHLAFAVLLTIGFSAASNAQTRRGLDQLDLVTVSRSAAPAAPTSPVEIDLETYKLVAPLIDHCKKLERDYQTSIVEDKIQLGRAVKYQRFMEKSAAVYRSVYLIKQMQTLADPVKAVVDDNQQISEDVANVLATLAYNNADTFKEQLAAVSKRFAVTDTGNSVADRERLVTVMLQRMNANFARLKIAADIR